MKNGWNTTSTPRTQADDRKKTQQLNKNASQGTVGQFGSAEVLAIWDQIVLALRVHSAWLDLCPCDAATGSTSGEISNRLNLAKLVRRDLAPQSWNDVGIPRKLLVRAGRCTWHHVLRLPQQVSAIGSTTDSARAAATTKHPGTLSTSWLWLLPVASSRQAQTEKT